MQEPSTRASPLSVHRAFVVHMRTEADVARGRLTGRVEHVISGQAVHFNSLEDLLAFMQQVLDQQQAASTLGCLKTPFLGQIL